MILNSDFNEFDTYYDHNYNIVYYPRNWFYKEDNNSHPLYFSTDRFLNKEVVKKIHPDGRLIHQGKIINYIGLPILPNPETFYTKLITPLVKSKTYKISIDVKAYDYCNCMTNMVVGFSESLPDSFNIKEVILKIPAPYSFQHVFYNWVTLESEYLASGKETYFVVGTQDSAKYIQCIASDLPRYDHRNMHNRNFRLSYGIDNVRLCAVEKQDELKRVMDTLEVNNSFVLSNLYFESEKAALKNNSYPILFELLNYLEANKTVKIEIQGHTDNIGSKGFNDTLSFKRAMSVRNYLIENGILENRLTLFGFGYEKPISSNESDSTRELNRRVEIKLLEK